MTAKLSRLPWSISKYRMRASSALPLLAFSISLVTAAYNCLPSDARIPAATWTLAVLFLSAGGLVYIDLLRRLSVRQEVHFKRWLLGLICLLATTCPLYLWRLEEIPLEVLGDGLRDAPLRATEMIHGIIQEPFAIGDYGGSTRLLPLLQLPFSWLFPADVLGVRLPGVMVTLLGGIIIFTLTCSLLGATTGFVCGALYLLHPLIWFQARSELLIAMTPVLAAPCIWYLVRQLGAHSRLELAQMGFIAGFSLWFHQAAPLAWLVAWVSRGIAQILSGASRTTIRDFLSESSWLALGALVSSSPQVIFAGHMISARTGTMATDLSLPLILEKYLGFLQAFYKPVFAGFHAPVLPVGFTAGLAGLILLILAILILIKTQSISRVATSSLFLWIVVSGFSHRVLTSGPLAPHRLIFVIVPLVCLIGFGLTSPRLFRPLHGRETPPSSMVRYTASFALVWFLGFIPLSIHIFRASHTEQNLDQLRLLSSGLARATANKSVSLTYPMCIFVPNHAVASAFSFGHVHEQFRYFINPKALFQVTLAPDKLPTPYSVAIGDCDKDIPLTMELYGSWRQWQFFLLQKMTALHE